MSRPAVLSALILSSAVFMSSALAAVAETKIDFDNAKCDRMRAMGEVIPYSSSYFEKIPDYGYLSGSPYRDKVEEMVMSVAQPKINGNFSDPNFRVNLRQSLKSLLPWAFNLAETGKPNRLLDVTHDGYREIIRRHQFAEGEDLENFILVSVALARTGDLDALREVGGCFTGGDCLKIYHDNWASVDSLYENANTTNPSTSGEDAYNAAIAKGECLLAAERKARGDKDSLVNIKREANIRLGRGDFNGAYSLIQSCISKSGGGAFCDREAAMLYSTPGHLFYKPELVIPILKRCADLGDGLCAFDLAAGYYYGTFSIGTDHNLALEYAMRHQELGSPMSSEGRRILTQIEYGRAGGWEAIPPKTITYENYLDYGQFGCEFSLDCSDHWAVIEALENMDAFAINSSHIPVEARQMCRDALDKVRNLSDTEQGTWTNYYEPVAICRDVVSIHFVAEG